MPIRPGPVAVNTGPLPERWGGARLVEKGARPDGVWWSEPAGDDVLLIRDVDGVALFGIAFADAVLSPEIIIDWTVSPPVAVAGVNL